MIDINNMFDKLIEITKEERDSIKDVIIESLTPYENESELWQVEHTITEIIEGLQRDLYYDDVIKKDNELQIIIDGSDRNIRNEMFKILIEPIVEYYNKNNYGIDVDYFWEEIRVYKVKEC